MDDLSLRLEILPWILGMLIITSCVHEAGHAWTAFRLGDHSEHVRERVTPFTWKHISLPFTIILPSLLLLFAGIMIGGARPVRVRTAVGPARMAVIALAGPIGNLFCGFLSVLVVAGLVHSGWLTIDMAFGFDNHYVYALQAVLLNVILAALNLIPLPPFDGSRIVALFLPQRLRDLYYGFSWFTILCLGVVFFALYFVFDEDIVELARAVLLEIHTIVIATRDWIA